MVHDATRIRPVPDDRYHTYMALHGIIISTSNAVVHALSVDRWPRAHHIRVPGGAAGRDVTAGYRLAGLSSPAAASEPLTPPGGALSHGAHQQADQLGESAARGRNSCARATNRAA